MLGTQKSAWPPFPPGAAWSGNGPGFGSKYLRLVKEITAPSTPRSCVVLLLASSTTVIALLAPGRGLLCRICLREQRPSHHSSTRAESAPRPIYQQNYPKYHVGAGKAVPGAAESERACLILKQSSPDVEARRLRRHSGKAQKEHQHRTCCREPARLGAGVRCCCPRSGELRGGPSPCQKVRKTVCKSLADASCLSCCSRRDGSAHFRAPLCE